MKLKQECDRIWNNINKKSINFLNEHFESLSPFLLKLMIIFMEFVDECEVGTYEDRLLKGSTLIFSLSNNEKQLEIRCKKNLAYELLLSIYEDNGDLTTYRYKLEAHEVETIPKEIRRLMERVVEINEPLMFKNSLID